jgi:hypothetical protein
VPQPVELRADDVRVIAVDFEVSDVYAVASAAPEQPPMEGS